MIIQPYNFEQSILRHQLGFHRVVDFDPQKEKLCRLDFTSANTTLGSEIIDDENKFSEYVRRQLELAHCQLGIGGYAEHRTVYSRSRVFDAATPGEEPRRLHLGVDIWGPVGKNVYAFMGGMVHSRAFNDNYGDYGATLVLLHQLDGMPFYTLYGHLGLQDIQKLDSGQYVTRGQVIGHFGDLQENGHWPPHLHFQLILDMELNKGDYPGVCKYSEREKYLANCPDPDLVLQLNKYLPNLPASSSVPNQ
jgi:peptidoglycan LD-endopeptidase LytH